MSLTSGVRTTVELLRQGQWAVVFRNLPYVLWKKWHRLDLGHVSIADLTLPADGHECEDSGGPDLAMVLKTLPLTTQDWALDVGCGKGGALFTLARFLPTIGLEFDAGLVAVAEENESRLGYSLSCVHQGDAATFTDLDCYTLFYIFNSFGSDTLRAFLGNVATSLRHRPRPVRLIYRNPMGDTTDILQEFGWTLEREFTHARHPILVYRQ